MKRLTSIILFVSSIAFSSSSFAIEEWCSTGAKGGLVKTAYAITELDWWEYYLSGYFYAMMISVDIDQNVSGQWAVGGRKSFRQNAGSTMWISRVGVEGSFRKVHGSGGLSPYSGKICQSAYTQVIYAF